MVFGKESNHCGSLSEIFFLLLDIGGIAPLLNNQFMQGKPTWIRKVHQHRSLIEQYRCMKITLNKVIHEA